MLSESRQDIRANEPLATKDVEAAHKQLMQKIDGGEYTAQSLAKL